jgi:hypothetical protein
LPGVLYFRLQQVHFLELVLFHRSSCKFQIPGNPEDTTDHYTTLIDMNKPHADGSKCFPAVNVRGI